MSFQGSFGPLGRKGFISSTPVAFLDTWFGDQGLFRAGKGSYAYCICLCSQTIMTFTSSRCDYAFPDPFRLSCFPVLPCFLLISHNIILCWFCRATPKIIRAISELVAQTFLRPLLDFPKTPVEPLTAIQLPFISFGFNTIGFRFTGIYFLGDMFVKDGWIMMKLGRNGFQHVTKFFL